MFIEELESIEHEIDCDKKRELLIKLTVWYKRSEEKKTEGKYRLWIFMRKIHVNYID
jgi:hypothetical protein